jgi:TetR/AcrR family transcriptional repressor of nem operon
MGYEKSSMGVLLKGMGIQKGSFYATFKSKHQIFVEALRLYIQTRFEAFQALREQHAPLEALRRHLDQILDESIGSRRFMGCFLVNCALEVAPRDRVVRDIVDGTLRAHATFYQSLLEDAKRRGDLPAGYDAEGRASALLGLVLGMRVHARGGLPDETLRLLRRQADALLGVPAR